MMKGDSPVGVSSFGFLPVKEWRMKYLGVDERERERESLGVLVYGHAEIQFLLTLWYI